MKYASEQLKAHMALDSTTLAILWKLTRTDGVVMGFTTHDQDVVYGPVTYYAATGFAPSATDSGSDMSVDNAEVTGLLDSESITEADIRAGIYDNAVVEQRLVNWDDLTMGDVLIRTGMIGNLQMKNGLFSCELRGLTQKLTTVLGSTYGPVCRSELGSGGGSPVLDSGSHWKCRVNLDDYRQAGSVASAADAKHITPNAGLIIPGSSPEAETPEGWFDNGILTFTNGELDGWSFEIKSWDGSVLTLFLAMPTPPAPADTFDIEPGCDHTVEMCYSKFDNVINFRGEPFIPGADLVLNYPDAKV